MCKFLIASSYENATYSLLRRPPTCLPYQERQSPTHDPWQVPGLPKEGGNLVAICWRSATAVVDCNIHQCGLKECAMVIGAGNWTAFTRYFAFPDYLLVQESLDGEIMIFGLIICHYKYSRFYQKNYSSYKPIIFNLLLHQPASMDLPSSWSFPLSWGD